MSIPTVVGSFRFSLSVTVRVGTRADGLCWWAEYSAAEPPVPARPARPSAPFAPTIPAHVGGRIHREASGFIADSPCFLIGDRRRGYETPEQAAVAAWRRETAMAPVADGIARAHPGRAAVFLMDGNEPSWPWPWLPDATARPENLVAWERQAVAAAATYRRFSVILKDLDECRTWIVEARLNGVGIVWMPADDGGTPVRWLAALGGKQRLLGGPVVPLFNRAG